MIISKLSVRLESDSLAALLCILQSFDNPPWCLSEYSLDMNSTWFHFYRKTTLIIEHLANLGLQYAYYTWRNHLLLFIIKWRCLRFPRSINIDPTWICLRMTILCLTFLFFPSSVIFSIYVKKKSTKYECSHLRSDRVINYCTNLFSKKIIVV